MSDNLNKKQEVTIDSPPKRKRGRPRKNPEKTGISNEGKNVINMNNNNMNNINNNSVHNGIFQPKTVKDIELVSLQAVQQKWNCVFNKYANLIGNGRTINDIIENPAYANRLNPFVQNQRVKSIISQGEKIDKEKIIKYCEDPANNEYNLQNASWAMYYQSQVYQTLLRIDREVPRFHFYAVPEGIKMEDLEKDTYKKERKKVNSILKVLKPKVTFKDIITQISNEGKSFYVPRISYDDKEAFFFTFQKLPSKYCKVVGFGSEEHFVIMFDMSLFMTGIYDPLQYPEFIQDKWNDMINNNIISKNKKGEYRITSVDKIPKEDLYEIDGNTWSYWYRIPQNMAFTFSQDGGSPNVVPDTVGLLQDVVDLSDYKILQQSLLAKGATAILTAEAQIKPDTAAGTDGTYVNVDTLLGITDYVTQSVGETIVPVFFPLHDYKLHSIQEDVSPATTVVTSRLKDVVNTSALGGLISTTDKPSIITVKTARDLQEAKMRYIVSQFENAVNKVINTSFGLNYNWKVHFWGYAFSELDDLKLMKELILSGVKGLLPRYLSAYDLTLEDYSIMCNMCNAENVKIIKDELIYQIEANEKMQKESLEASLEQQQQQSNLKVKDTGINETKTRGRPAKSDEDISDNTAISREGGGNLSEVKEFIMENFVDSFTEDELEEMVTEELMNEMKNTNQNKPKN